MRDFNFLSPSSLSKFESNRDLAYLQYLSPFRTKRPPQEPYMAVGSAFDAFAKSGIHTAIYGETATKGSQFEFQKIFETQVEPHVRDYALKMGQHLFDQYNVSGAYGHLLADIIKGKHEPQMEFEVKGEIQGVNILGRPDLRYFTAEEIHVITDWKVNGAGSTTGASPQQGYKVCRDYGSRTHGKAHAKFCPFDFHGLEINRSYLNEFVDYWADQLTMYGWVLGEPMGSEEWVIRIEQIACRPIPSIESPRAKFATHLARSQEAYQMNLMARIHDCWNAIQTGHIFTELSREDSDARCEALDMQAQTPVGLHPALAEFANETMRIG